MRSEWKVRAPTEDTVGGGRLGRRREGNVGDGVDCDVDSLLIFDMAGCSLDEGVRYGSRRRSYGVEGGVEVSTMMMVES